MRFPTPSLALVCVAEPPMRVSRVSLWKGYHNSTRTGWLNKPVAKLKLLDDAKTGSTWQLVNVEQAHGEVPLTGGRVVRARGPLRLRCTRIGDKPAPATHCYYETASLRRVAPGTARVSWLRAKVASDSLTLAVPGGVSRWKTLGGDVRAEN